MQQYVIIAQDGNDEGAMERRKNIRQTHLEGAKKLKENNNFILGGAILDEEGKMRGSVMMVQFESEEDFRKWYEKEPYITAGVWKKIEVRPFRVADV